MVVQELVLHTDTVLFRCERWYSPGNHQTYQAPLPAGYHGPFGPGVRALALYLCYQANRSQAKVRALFASVGLSLAAGHLATLLTEQPGLATEYAAIGRAALAARASQHLDETPTRLDGVEQHCHVLVSPFATVYRTTAGKDRLTATRDLPRLGDQQRRAILDAAAIGAYRVPDDVPVVATLLADDAPQWKGSTPDLARCWIHEGRHYQQLDPSVAAHRQLLDDFRRDFWAYYRARTAYREQPSLAEAARLSLAFDTLFAQQTGYVALDERIAKTRVKKAELLRVLDHPTVPLHNNPAELAARRRVRKRAVRFGARSPAGLFAWDVCQTILATAEHLGVNVRHYLQDRLSDAYRLPALADLITQHTAASPQIIVAAA